MTFRRDALQLGARVQQQLSVLEQDLISSVREAERLGDSSYFRGVGVSEVAAVKFFT